VVWPLSKKRGGPPVSLGEGYGKGAGLTGGCRPLKKRGPVPVLYGGRERSGAAESPAPAKKRVRGTHSNRWGQAVTPMILTITAGLIACMS
jgi:hypothetical protein